MNAKTFPLPFQIEGGCSLTGAPAHNHSKRQSIYRRLGLALLYLAALPVIAAAQVVVGSATDAGRAALLELKTQSADAANISSVSDDANVTSTKGGLVLPRVRLINPATLEPFIPASDPAWTSNAAKIRETHTGLSVYNLTSDANFIPGVYSWNGTRWVLVASPNVDAGSGISLNGDKFELGGTVTRLSEVDNGAHRVRVVGQDSLNMGSPLQISGPLKYLDGNQPVAADMLLMSDSAGYAVWEPQSKLPSTPIAVFSAKGVDGVNLRNYVGAGKWIDTQAWIRLPPGRWFVMVTMRAVLGTGDLDVNDWIWLKTTFIAENETLPNPAYFEANNGIIPARVIGRDQMISGYLVINNPRKVPLRFRYHIGEVEIGSVSGSNSLRIQKFAGAERKENIIAVFALSES
ncbi:MAG: hypothetical protein LBD21_10280 [Tannerellaceae bacterium]|nr:hypothetical protein [Tannerellaceae bacterium]